MSAQCDRCGAEFADGFLEALRRAIPDGTPMTRHGEVGVMTTSLLCDACRALPPKAMAEFLVARCERRHPR
jgi:hypothetical protein